MFVRVFDKLNEHASSNIYYSSLQDISRQVKSLTPLGDQRARRRERREALKWEYCKRLITPRYDDKNVADIYIACHETRSRDTIYHGHVTSHDRQL